MRFGMMGAAMAALLVAAPASALTTINFGATGEGYDSSYTRIGIFGQGLATATGTFSFSPIPGSSSYSYNGLSQTGIAIRSSALVEGDRLILSYSQGRDPASTSFDYGLTLQFKQGFLSNAFPTAFALSDVVSSSFSLAFAYTGGYGIYQTFFGPVTSISATTTGGGALPDGSAYAYVSTVRAVPEPATWALMLAGFGFVGFAMRRRKVTTRVTFA